MTIKAKQHIDRHESLPEIGVDLLIRSIDADLGSFSVRRALPYRKRCMVGPWIFFDHMGPADFVPGTGIDVRPHPHINLATVTYLFDGEILHRDSVGSVQVIKPGAINLMVAGSGIVHSERTDDQLRTQGHRVHGLQLWLALPNEFEEIEPAFFHYPAEKIPSTTVNGVQVRVMMGNLFGLQSPVKAYSPTSYFEAQLEAEQSLAIPDEVEERAIYIVEGSVEIQDTTIQAHSMLILTEKSAIKIKAKECAQIAFIGGASVGERFIWWNFVSSDKNRIERAKQDWQQGKFEKVPGETEFIPLPE